MGSWERFDETWLPDEKDFYSKLNLEDISDEDYTHAQKYFKELKLKKPRWLSWLGCSKWYIIACRCIWKL